MPNYYTNVLLMHGGWDPETEELWDAAIVAEEMKKLGWAKSALQRVCPAPYPDSLKSQREALIQELRDVYRVKEVAWVGMDPYSDEIGVERWPQSRAEEE